MEETNKQSIKQGFLGKKLAVILVALLVVLSAALLLMNLSKNTSKKPGQSNQPVTTGQPLGTLSLVGDQKAVPNQPFSVKVTVKNDNDAANLYAAKINFPSRMLQVVSIKKDGSFVTNWVERYSNNQTGQVSIIGAVPNPGYKTQGDALLATIVFKPLQEGAVNISFGSDSVIYRNSDNKDILTAKNNLRVSISSASPSAKPAK